MYFKAWRNLGELPREVWILFFVTLINRAGTMVLPFLVLYLTRSMGWSPERAGLSLTLYGIGALVSAPLGGWLSDRYGSLLVMRASLFFSAIAFFLFPFAKSTGTIIAVTVLLAIVSESFRPANLAAVSDYVDPSQRRTAFALIRLAINLGMSVGPAVGGFLATVSFNWIFLIDGLTSLAASVLLLLSRFRPLEEKTIPLEGSPGMTFAGLRDLPYVFFLIAVLPVCIVFFQHEAAMPLFMVRDLGLTEAAYGLMFTVNTVMIVFLEVPINHATNHWPFSRTLALGSMLIGAGFGALAFATGVKSVVLTVMIWTFGEMMLLPSMSAYAAHVAPPERRGEYMGLYTMTFSVAFCIGPWLGTVVLEHLGTGVLWPGTFVFGLISTVLLYRIKGGKSTESGG